MEYDIFFGRAVIKQIFPSKTGEHCMDGDFGQRSRRLECIADVIDVAFFSCRPGPHGR